jgi:predicted Co/Zn/Cd cation transporter (cation efflux family)
MFPRPVSRFTVLQKAEPARAASKSDFSAEAVATCTRRASRADCSCRHCRRARRLDRMEPLNLSDRAWLGAVCLAWVVVVGFAIYFAVQS